MQVPLDGRPQLSGLQAAAINIDRGRSPGYGVIPVPGGRYILEEERRAPMASYTDGPPGAMPAPEGKLKSAASGDSPARTIWPHLK
jgi:hypothetical protein